MQGFAELQYVNGFCEFPGAPWAAAELAEDLPCLELRVRPLARRAESRMGAVGLNRPSTSRGSQCSSAARNARSAGENRGRIVPCGARKYDLGG